MPDEVQAALKLADSMDKKPWYSILRAKFLDYIKVQVPNHFHSAPLLVNMIIGHALCRAIKLDAQ